MSRRTRTGSIPCERGRWDELGEYVDHRRRDARRQLEDIKGSRTERIVRGAEPLAANLAPFRIGPAPPLYVGDCARDEPAPRTQLSVDSPGLLDGGEPAHGRVRGRAVPRRLLPLPLIRCRRLRQSGCARHATMCRLAASRLPVVPVTTATSASQTAARSGGAVAVIPAAAVAAGGRRPPPRRRWPRLRRHSAARRTGGGSTAVIPAAALGALDSVAAAASAWVRAACAGVSPSASGLLPRRPVVPVAGPRRHPGCFLGFGNCSVYRRPASRWHRRPPSAPQPGIWQPHRRNASGGCPASTVSNSSMSAAPSVPATLVARALRRRPARGPLAARRSC